MGRGRKKKVVEVELKNSGIEIIKHDHNGMVVMINGIKHIYHQCHCEDQDLLMKIQKSKIKEIDSESPIVTEVMHFRKEDWEKRGNCFKSNFL